MIQRGAARAALPLLLLMALAWRLNNVRFGLPGMYDPDEPMFMLVALKLPLQGTLNPGWFGHPGSTTIYLLALIDVIVVGGGILTGSYRNIGQFTAAAYSDPSILFVPARVLMVLLGVGAVWLTYILGKRLLDRTGGLIAATFLALNGLHISWSQVIRTDIHASLFMLGSLIFAVEAGEHGRLKHWLLAGLMAGFATATKWPAASIFVATVAAYAFRLRLHRSEAATASRHLAFAIAATLVGVFIASPFIFLDWRTVLSNVSGEMRAGHLGHTGAGFLSNLLWYLQHQVAGTMGWAGLLLVAGGSIACARSSRIAKYTLIPAAIGFLVVICRQNLVWSRWILPVLPIFCIFAAAGVLWAGRRIAQYFEPRRRRACIAAVTGIALLPSLSGAVAQSKERANDTRSQAVEWAIANIPRGNMVVLEHLELNLRGQPWRILFPMGDAGCVDAIQLLTGRIRYDEVQKLRHGSNIVDLGNVSPEKIETCRADYAILTYYDLYRAEADTYPKQIASYQKILAGGRTVALFAPRPGEAGGPIVRIVAVKQRR